MTAAPAPLSDAPAPSGVRECGTCHRVRPVEALAVVVENHGAPAVWRCAEGDCRKPGGRPAVGPPLLIRMPAELRADVEALGRAGESLAATARRLLAAAVTAAAEKTLTGSRAEKTEPDPASPPACPDCGGPRELSLGNVAMCGQCGGIFDLAAAEPEPARPVTLPASASDAAAVEGARVVLAETWRGEPVAIGPVFTDKGAAGIETSIGAHPGWFFRGVVRIISKAQLDWNWDR